jgi:hypothetical protein
LLKHSKFLDLDFAQCHCEGSTVTTKQKRGCKKKAAGYVAGLILDSLESFAEPERRARLKKVCAALTNSSPGCRERRRS